MSHFLDHAIFGDTGEPARAARYAPNHGERLAQVKLPPAAMGALRNVRDPSETVQTGKARDIPDFWKPIEEWAVD